MSNEEKIIQLFSLCLHIQKNTSGESGPYVKFETSNYGKDVWVLIMDKGFSSSCVYDGDYTFSFTDIPDRTYENCKNHLLDLLKEVQGEAD